jgi:hypothetical protein
MRLIASALQPSEPGEVPDLVERISLSKNSGVNYLSRSSLDVAVANARGTSKYASSSLICNY